MLTAYTFNIFLSETNTLFPVFLPLREDLFKAILWHTLKFTLYSCFDPFNWWKNPSFQTFFSVGYKKKSLGATSGCRLGEASLWPFSSRVKLIQFLRYVPVRCRGAIWNDLPGTVDVCVECAHKSASHAHLFNNMHSLYGQDGQNDSILSYGDWRTWWSWPL